VGVKKIGVFTTQKYAKLLCKALAWATPLITGAYPSNTALQAALAAANAACATLAAELELVREYGD